MMCPACGKENKDGARGCLFCPESFEYEDDPDRPKQKFNNYSPSNWPLTVWFGALAVAGFGAWKVLNGVMNLGESGAKNPISRLMSFQTTIPNFDPTKVPGTGTPGAARVEMQLKKGDDAAAAHPDYWHMTGTVRDLATLSPVAGVAMAFQGGDNRAEAVTDEQGKYSVAAPPLDHSGYKVVIKKEGYASSYLNPSADSVPKMDAADRQGLAHDLAQSNDGPYEVQPTSPDPFTTDFFIAPLPPKN